MEFERRRRVSTNLNLTPLVDVVFNLLLFFMLCSQFVTQPGIKITLPSAVTGKLYPEEDIIISITEDNSLYLNKKLVTLENLLEQLEIEITTTEKKTVIIKADEKIDLGLAVKVMDIAREADAERLIISTRLEENVKR